jgi:hypothetical protein
MISIEHGQWSIHACNGVNCSFHWNVTTYLGKTPSVFTTFFNYQQWWHCTIASSILYNLQLCYNLNVVGFDFEYWVKPRSITWFLIFLLTEYDDGWWIQNFYMSKETLFDIANKLKSMIVKKDIRYHVIILVKLRWFVWLKTFSWLQLFHK